MGIYGGFISLSHVVLLLPELSHFHHFYQQENSDKPPPTAPSSSLDSLSHPTPLSLPFPSYLSLSLSFVFLSPGRSTRLACDHVDDGEFTSTHRREWIRRFRIRERQVPSRQGATHGDSRPCVGELWRSNDETPSPATPTTISMFQSIPINLLVVLVPSIREENARIDDMHFCTNYRNFDS